ncbi:glutamic acid-rich protein-like isoform X3 [Acropora millepora]|uniref:glutamic acid-rich protein-like isoform X3 n=1 Tax=Acropora millepora TaxID=45264 RepID=UPI001CF14842|nr:glutamic acid-rich protein-like isoform X3 [Acropora millepora]
MNKFLLIALVACSLGFQLQYVVSEKAVMEPVANDASSETVNDFEVRKDTLAGDLEDEEGNTEDDVDEEQTTEDEGEEESEMDDEDEKFEDDVDDYRDEDEDEDEDLKNSVQVAEDAMPRSKGWRPRIPRFPRPRFPRFPRPRFPRFPRPRFPRFPRPRFPRFPRPRFPFGKK